MSENIEIETVYNPYYKLNTGEIYDKDNQKFVTVETDEDYKKFIETGNLPLSIGENGYTKELLINSVLNFYKWPIGECLLSLEELKQKKLEQVGTITATFEENLNKDMYFISSLGFKSDGDRRTRTNIEDLIQFFDLQAQDGKVPYRDYNNETQELTKEQLRVLLQEQIMNGKELYNQKWALQDAINGAQSIEDLKKIEIKFTMKDFTA